MTAEEMWYRLVVRDKFGLLAAMVRDLAGDAHISLEGDLSRCAGLSTLRGASAEETSALKRNTILPRQDFIVVPLEGDLLDSILAAAFPEGRVTRNVIHIQIEKSGRLEFGTYDNFYPGCTVARDRVSKRLLEDLVRRRVLRSFEAVLAPGPE